MKKSKLPLYTFLAVFLAILLVGVFALPVFLNILQTNYFKLQAEANYRQAKSMAEFVKSRLAQGTPKDQVLEEFQATLAGTEMDKGFVCIIDQGTTNYLCHPMVSTLGMSVALKNALYDANYDDSDLIKWEEEVVNGKSGGGLLHYANDMPSEVVYFHAIPEVNWTISSHENAELVRAEVDKIKSYLTIGSIIFGLMLAFPISWAVRRVGRGYESQIEKQNVLLDEERVKSDRLLENILPPAIANRMKQQEEKIVDHFSQASVLFCDIVNFTTLSARTSPQDLVTLLNRVFSEFDRLSNTYGVEKVKTIGDAYMAVCGVPEPVVDHATPIAKMALKMTNVVQQIDPELNIRIGLHCGEVVAGVIGTKKFSYDLWGDTVNTASRLESHGVEGKIHCSEAFYELLKDNFEFQDRGTIEIKGKGDLHTYFLLNQKS
ncbi:MAG: adenylate/guanylate cyclase domain-containing protein [Cyclobacteriaceae bacterium]